MIILASTSDKLQVTTGAATPVDVHASFADYDGTNVTLGRKDTEIVSAATVDVVNPPSVGVRRNVKTLHIRNVHASASVTVEVKHTDGANVVTLERVTLLAGEQLSYMEFEGFRHILANGSVKSVDVDAFEVLYNSMANSLM